MTLFITLFVSGVLTILLPCILPLIPIVLGISIAGRSKWRPLFTALGMLISFVLFTFLLFTVFSQFVTAADYLRLATYYILFLFGLGFFTHDRTIHTIGAAVGALLFFYNKFSVDGGLSILLAAILGMIAMHVGGKVATKIQTFGSSIQGKTRAEFGDDTPITALIIGLTLGLVWVPCAGPALSFAFTLVRDEPGPRAFLLLFAYGLGSALPLVLIGYGGQYAVHSVRAISKYSGHIKKVSGALLVITAIAFQFNWFTSLQTWFVNNTPFGAIGTDIELALFGDEVGEDMMPTDKTLRSPETTDMTVSSLPKLERAPEFVGLGPWHNSEPFTLADLKGKVVLIDFWTYSCINCIRTLPYIQGYWEKYGVTKSDGTIDLENTPFVLLAVHTPEFVFEKSEQNVADAIDRHGLTYPSAQDNDFGTWRAFANRYWPAKYLIDAQGYIRYEHIGEGAYDETDVAIAELLREAGQDIDVSSDIQPDRASGRNPQSAETYLGERSWPAFGNAKGNPSMDVMTYAAPDAMDLHRYYLVGDWQLSSDGERQSLISDTGEIRMRFLGGEANLVLGIEEGSAEAIVMIDGEETDRFTIRQDDLYPLFKGDYGEHELALKINGKGVSTYAFTFGQ